MSAGTPDALTSTLEDPTHIDKPPPRTYWVQPFFHVGCLSSFSDGNEISHFSEFGAGIGQDEQDQIKNVLNDSIERHVSQFTEVDAIKHVQALMLLGCGTTEAVVLHRDSDLSEPQIVVRGVLRNGEESFDFTVTRESEEGTETVPGFENPNTDHSTYHVRTVEQSREYLQGFWGRAFTNSLSHFEVDANLKAEIKDFVLRNGRDVWDRDMSAEQKEDEEGKVLADFVESIQKNSDNKELSKEDKAGRSRARTRLLTPGDYNYVLEMRDKAFHGKPRTGGGEEDKEEEESKQWQHGAIIDSLWAPLPVNGERVRSPLVNNPRCRSTAAALQAPSLT